MGLDLKKKSPIEVGIVIFVVGGTILWLVGHFGFNWW